MKKKLYRHKFTREILADIPESQRKYYERVYEYYTLPLDNYGQPSGIVVPVMMTRKEFKETSGYVFKTYEAAMYRAMD